MHHLKQSRKNDHIARLPKQALWRQLSQTIQEQLLSHSNVSRASRGDDINADVGILLKGTLGIRQSLQDGRNSLCVLFHEGDLFDRRRQTRQTQGQLMALNDVAYISLDGATLDKCMQDHGDASRVMIDEIREQFARQSDHTADITIKTPIERIAAVLFEMRRWPESACEPDDQSVIHIPIQRTDIAAYMGMQPETVSRAIHTLEHDELISLITRSEIQITNTCDLRLIANGAKSK